MRGVGAAQSRNRKHSKALGDTGIRTLAADFLVKDGHTRLCLFVCSERANALTPRCRNPSVRREPTDSSLGVYCYLLQQEFELGDKPRDCLHVE